eukprot:1828087-Prymnesium_polylepis.1
MFLCASRLPSFAPGHWPSRGTRGSKSQVTAGVRREHVGLYALCDGRCESAHSVHLAEWTLCVLNVHSMHV